MHQSAAAWHHAEEGESGLPAGVIIGINATASAGSDFDAYNNINGRFTKADGSSFGSTGGNYNFSKGSNSSGSHSGPVNHKAFLRQVAGAGGELCMPKSGGSHNHTFYGTYVPTKSQLKLIKANKDGASIPVGAISFGKDANLSGGMDNDRAFSALDGGYLFPATTTSKVNASSSGSSSNTSDSHNHHNKNCGSTAYANCCAANTTSNPSAGGSHGHSVSCNVTSLSLKLFALKAFERVVADQGAVEGMIGMWDQGTANIPDGWALCNGQNGTPDLTDRFIHITSAPYGAGGNNTMTASLSGSSKSHSHGWSQWEASGWVWDYAHTSSVSHSHSATYSGSYTPEFYTAVFIQKI